VIFPQGYHITWGTYGARLPGCDRPHVTRDQNEYGTPLPLPDPHLEELAENNLVQPPVRLSIEQRREVEDAVLAASRRYEWTVHTLAAQSDHVHVVITAMRVGDELRDALKACATRALNARYAKQKWWARDGSCRYLWERDYFLNCVNYVGVATGLVIAESRPRGGAAGLPGLFR
jgi:REP element-mobilizing transposase RayT